jgi:hypothetical protein
VDKQFMDNLEFLENLRLSCIEIAETIEEGLESLCEDDDPHSAARLLRKGLSLAFAGLPELTAARLTMAIVDFLCWSNDDEVQRNYDRIEAAMRPLPDDLREGFGEAIADLIFGFGFNPKIVVVRPLAAA